MMRHATLTLVAMALVMAACTLPARAGGKKASVDELRARLERQDEGVVKDVKACDLEARKALAPDLLKAFFAYDWDTAMKLRWVLVDLGRAAPDSLVPRIVQRWKATPADQLHIRLPLVELLRHLGPAADGALPVLIEALQSDDLNLQRQAAMAVRAIGPDAKQAVPAVTGLLKSRDALLRSLAVRVLRAIGPGPEAVPALIQALASEDREVRRYAVRALGTLGPKARQAVPALCKVLQGDEPFLKLRAVQALGSIGHAAKDAVPALLRLAEDKSVVTQQAVSAALKSIKTENQPPVASPARVSCPEGKSVQVELPVTDPDDVPLALHATITKKPAHGTLERTGPLAFTYTAKPGHVGQDTWTWQATDGTAKSQAAEAVVQVRPDKTPPQVTSVAAVGKNDRLRITFSEPVAPDSASTPDHYAIQPGVQVRKAALSKDGQTVTLTTSALSPDTDYTVAVKGIQDRAAAANTLKPTRKPFRYYAWERTGLILWARAEGNAQDESGHKHHGTLSEGVSYAPNGVIGQAFQFAGAGGDKKNAVSFGDIDEMDSAAAFTVALWFQRAKDRSGDSNHTISNILVSQGSDGENDNLEIGTQGANVEVYLHTAGADEHTSCPAGIRDGQWHHLALIYEGKRTSKARLYVDGKCVKTWGLWKGPLHDSAGSPFTLGNTHHEETPFAGLVDEVYLFLRALEEKEVRALAAQR